MIRILPAKATNGNTILVFDETPLNLVRDSDILKISQQGTPSHLRYEHPHISH